MRFWILCMALAPLFLTSCVDKGLSSDEQLERDEALIEDYLSTNG